MFDHKHYVPILKGKRAEFPALGSLKSKSNLTPLVEAVPSRGAMQIPRDMEGEWPNKQRYFIDLVFMDDPDDTQNPAGNDHPVMACFAEVANKGATRSSGYWIIALSRLSKRCATSRRSTKEWSGSSPYARRLRGFR